MRRRFGPAVGVVAAGLLLLAAPNASAAISHEAGWGCVADSSRAGLTLLASPIEGHPHSPLVKEARAVIVNWGVRVGPGLPPLAQQLGVFRQVNGGAEYTKVAESAVATFSAGTEAVPARIPVRAGDHIGLHGPVGTFVCDGEWSGSSAVFRGSVAVDETRAFESEAGVGSPVIAVVEIDEDGDGYGDASQDECPETAAFHDTCPPLWFLKGKPHRYVIVVRLRPVQKARVGVSCRIALPGDGGRGATAQITMPPRTIDAGATAAFRLALPRSVKASLRELGRGGALRTRIAVRTTGRDDESNTRKLTVKLPGRERGGG